MSSELHYIHIGKCGGKTLWSAVNSSETLAASYPEIKRIHIKKPKYSRSVHYLIVLRNPISRALSAFNWRYKLVVETDAQRSRFYNEYETLGKYGTLNALAESLYVGGALNKKVAKEFRTIHHLKEDINFYLGHLLTKALSAQILPVMAQETLNSDMSEILGVDQVEDVHRHANQVADEKLKLSDTARENLRSFLTDDYLCITKLFCLGKIPDAKYARLMGLQDT